MIFVVGDDGVLGVVGGVVLVSLMAETALVAPQMCGHDKVMQFL